MASKKPVEKEKPKTPEATIAEIEKGLAPLTEEAATIVIKNENDVAEASTFLVKAKGYLTRINELEKFFTDPYVEQRRVALENKQKIEAMFAPKKLPLDTLMNKLKRAIGDFRLEQERAARAEEARLLKIREAANAKREQKGQEQILEPVRMVERAAPTIHVEGGKAIDRKVWRFEVQDLAALRKDERFMTELYMLATNKGLHEQVLRGMVGAGVREVAGVRIYEDIEVSVSAKR